MAGGRSFLQRLLRPFLPLVILAGLGLIYYLGVFSERTGFVREVLDPGLKRITLPVLNAFRGEDVPVDRLELLIPQPAMDSLAAIRDRALEAGVLDEGKDRWDTAQLVWQGDTIAVRLRLKGGLIDHLRTAKWSFRVQVLDSGSVMGMRTFSLQHPNTRNFTHEWLFHQALREEGLPWLRYRFLDVTVNGEDRGLHALEQHFDESLLDSLGLGPGPVVKFDDEARIGALRQLNERPFDSDPPTTADWQAAVVDAFHTKDVLADPVLKARFQRAVLQLEDFRAGRARTCEVFACDELAHLFALCDLLGAQHATDWRNLRFVPGSDGRLRPIGFDANAGEPIPAIRALREMGPVDFSGTRWGFFDRLFDDSTFFRSYVAWLDTLSTPGRLEDLLGNLAPDLDTALARVRQEFPNWRHDTLVYLHDRTVMRQTLEPRDALVAYLQAGGEHGPLDLALLNVHALPLEVIAVANDRDTLRLRDPILVPPGIGSGPPTYVNTRVRIAERGRTSVQVRLFGLERNWWIKVKPWKTSVDPVAP